MTISILVDWDHDRDFGDPTEDITAYVRSAAWALGLANPTDLLPMDDATFILSNQDGRFSPENPASPLYGNLVPGRRVKIMLNGYDIPLWHGWLRGMEVSVGQYGERCVTLQAGQGLFRLAQFPVRLPIQINRTTDAILDEIFRTLVVSPTLPPQWVVGDNTLGSTTFLYQGSLQIEQEIGKSEFVYYGEALDTTATALEALIPILEAEDGMIWQGRDGRWQFVNRHHWITDFVGADIFTLDTLAVAADYHYGADLLSLVQVTAYPRVLSAAGAVIWQSEAPIRVGAGETRTTWVRIPAEKNARYGVLAVLPPQLYTDYTALNTLGESRTGVVRVVAEVEAGAVKLTLSNDDRLPVDVTLQLRGQTIKQVEAYVAEARRDDNLLTYGGLAVHKRLPALDSVELAQNYAAWLLSNHDTPRGALTHLTLRPRDTAQWDFVAQATIDFDFSFYEEVPSPTYRFYFVVGEAWTYSPATGPEIRYTLRRIEPLRYWQVTLSALDTQTVVAY